MNVMGLLGIPFMMIWFAFLGLSLYCLYLFIQLATRGIKALDIYIDRNKNNML